MTDLMLEIDPDVHDVLRTTDGFDKVVRMAERGYECCVCGTRGTLSDTEMACVLALVHDCGAEPVVRLAHHSCSGSGILVVDDPMRIDLGAIWPGNAWLRPQPDTPDAVVLIGPRTPAARPAGERVVDRLSATLLGVGFTLLTTPDESLPYVEGLAVRLDPDGYAAVLDHDDITVWEGALVLPPGWAGAACESGRVGVVLAAGLNLHEPDRDHLADLFTVIGDGFYSVVGDTYAVGASAELLTD
jgi:hypothetical protein